MGRLVGKRQYRELLLALGLLCAALALVLWPGEAMGAMRDGLKLCGNVIVPSLFPFFVLSSLVVELGMSRYLGRLFQPVMAPLFRVNGACASALALGFVGGYPVGARTAISLYQNGQCSKTEAERLLAFCNNSGPAFIFGVVGAGVFGSGALGLLLYLVHMAASPQGAAPGGPVSNRLLPRRLHPLGHRGPVFHPEYLRLCAVFYRHHPHVQPHRRAHRPGPAALPAVWSPGF